MAATLVYPVLTVGNRSTSKYPQGFPSRNFGGMHEFSASELDLLARAVQSLELRITAGEPDLNAVLVLSIASVVLMARNPPTALSLTSFRAGSVEAQEFIYEG